MKNEIIEVGGQRWLVREAESRTAAIDEIGHARATGSVGSKSLVSEVIFDDFNELTDRHTAERVIADVVQLNADGNERQPYAA